MTPISLYIHIPFCSRKCLFCSFTVVVAQEHRSDEYIDAVLHEARTHRGREVNTVYLGGGTPGVLSEAQLRRLMAGLKNNFLFMDDCEIFIELNPENITLEKARALKDLGFTRVSVGIQSLQERFLRFLGRGHSAQKAVEAYQTLRDAGHENINCDLMYAFPGQTAEELEHDVRAIASLGSEHLSLYTLTVEPNSRFYATQMKLDDGEKLAQHYLMIGKILPEYGFEQYEVSNFARQGFESRHNFNYWQGGEYIALGVGAHGFLSGRRYWNTDRLQDYLKRVSETGAAIEGWEDLSEGTRTMEKVLFGLRTNRGIAMDVVPADKEDTVKGFISDGFLSLDQGVLKATTKGRLVLDELSVRLI